MRPLPDIQTPTFSFDLDHDYVHHLLCGALWGKGKEMSSVQTVNGSEEEFGPGEAYVIPPGHDGWIVGDETCVVVDVSSEAAKRFAKEA